MPAPTTHTSYGSLLLPVWGAVPAALVPAPAAAPAAADTPDAGDALAAAASVLDVPKACCRAGNKLIQLLHAGACSTESEFEHKTLCAGERKQLKGVMFLL
jgi:hypothetical protein